MRKAFYLYAGLLLFLSSSIFAQTEVSGFIETNSNWSLSGSPYIVTGNVVVEEGVTLEIDAGVVVKFSNIRVLRVEGTLNASGTLSNPVVFTSLKDDAYGGDSNGDGNASSPNGAEWITIDFKTTSTNSILNHCLIRHGGQLNDGAVTITGSNPTITNCTFENNEVGLKTYLDANPVVNNNTFLNNNLTPIKIGLAASFAAFNGNSFSNNQYNGIGISRETYEGNYQLSIPTLEGLENVPYVLYDNVTLEPSGQLTIDPGVLIKMDHLKTLTIEGSLQAHGTNANPIVFTAINDDEFGGDTNTDGNASPPVPGEWITINFEETSSNSILDHCTIKYGGQLNDGAVTVTGSNTSITNCTFDANIVGLKTSKEATPLVNNNAFVNNNRTPIKLSLGTNFSSFAGNSFSNNQYRGIGITRETYTGTYQLEVPDLQGLENVPYVLYDNVTLEPSGQLTIDPGVILKLANITGMNIEGALQANGTENNPIIFTSIKDDEIGGDTNGDGSDSSPATGAWIALNLNETGANTYLEHCWFKYGGQLNDGALVIEGGNPSLSNCRFEENEVGLKLRTDAAPMVNNSEFVNNSRTPIKIGLGTIFASFEGNTFSNNQYNGIGIERESYEETYSLAVPSLEGLENLPYVFFDNITIEPLGHLTIDPGVIIKIASISGFFIEGTLEALGTAEQPIVFTSIKDDTYGGDTNTNGTADTPNNEEWINIKFKESATNSILRHCIIKHGGQLNDGALKIEGETPIISNCIFRENKVAINKESLFAINIDSSLFCNNNRAAIRVEAGPMTIANSSFLNNADFDIENLGSEAISATDSWWNHATYTEIENDPLANLPNIYDGNDDADKGFVNLSNPQKSQTQFTVDVTGFTAFFNNNTNDVAAFEWNFGDGGNSSLANPTHLYPDFGFYQVCLEPANCDAAARGTICEEVLIKGISSIYPNVTGNSNTYVGFIKGAGFKADDEVKLFKAGENDITADTLVYIDSTLIKVFFSLDEVATGSWSLSVVGENMDEQLADILEIETSRPYSFSTVIEGRDRIRTNVPSKMRIGVTNNSNVTAFGVPLHISFSTGIGVDVKNEIALDTVPSEYAEYFKDNLFVLIDEDNPSDTTLVGVYIIPQLNPYESQYLDIEILVNTISESNLIAATAAAPWFSAQELIDAGVLYKSSFNEVPPCVECVLSALSLLPTPLGCMLGFANTIYSSLKLTNDVVQGNALAPGMTAVATGYLGVMLCAATGGAVPSGAIRSVVEGLEGLSKGADAGVALAECEECMEDLFPPTEHDFESANSFDPNDKVGPSGVTDVNYVKKLNTIDYTIFFENIDSATAPASEVFITDIIDTAILNINSLAFTGFGFGERNFDFRIPITDTSFTTDINLNPEQNVIVRVNGKVNYNLGQINWSFRTFDPSTMNLVEDIDLGFLPPNVNRPEGEGYVRLSIEPKPNLPHLTAINNGASIVFDNNDPIITPIWTNTIDIERPESSVDQFSGAQQDTLFEVSWAGDDGVGAGINYYTIYVAEEGGDFEIWQFRTTATAADFVGMPGKEYRFYSIATDRVGNIENIPSTEDAATSITGIRDLSNEKGYKLYQNVPNPFEHSTTIIFELPTAEAVTIEILNDYGAVTTILEENLPAGRHEVQWQPKDNSNGIYYYRLTAGGYTRTRKMVLVK